MLPYTAMPREAGSGPRRIGTKLQYSEDLYSLFFVSVFKSDYILYAKLNKENPDELESDDEENVKQLSKRLKKFQTKVSFLRSLLFSEMFCVFMFQMILIYFIITTSSFTKDPQPPNVVTAFSRFLTGLIMQIMMSHEISEGLDKMKFALNHNWKFEKPFLAWFCGFL